jgi:hypothetical protein
MTKRAFVLFLCFVQGLSFTLFSQRSVASCKLEATSHAFSFFSIHAADDDGEFVLCDDFIPRTNAIVRADPDDYEWKENLSNLLRHRYSTFRFLTEAVQVLPGYQFASIPKQIRECITLPAISKGAVALPSYYGYLHLLCPF